nr:hypothetical protein GCM10020185_48020 [Pseudomonas brassicacearum subsp. brassicacearum]
MLFPEEVLVYGDCVMNPHPSAAELAEIALQSADSAAAFGITPRVAMLSYSSGESASGEEVEKKFAKPPCWPTRPSTVC